MTLEEAAKATREKLEDVDDEDLEKIDNRLLVKIYNESFRKGYQQGYEARESISKLQFRFQDNLLASIYNKMRHIRQDGILLHLKLKLGLTSLPEIRGKKAQAG